MDGLGAAEEGDRPSRRTSRLGGQFQLLHADLHNHTVLSDGAGDHRTAFSQLRAAGLDVAALTDHASIPPHHLDRLDPQDYPDAEALRLARMAPDSLDDAGWRVTAELADAADQPGVFTAMRGFEWTEPWLGHANVWFSAGFLPVTTPGRLHGLHDWLAGSEPGALFGYNHPGREPGRFHDFEVTASLLPRLVGFEIFNRRDDLLLQGAQDGRGSPLVACLDAGWRPGLLGVSDEHSPHYGLAGRGRTGLWVAEHSRQGVREALEARRTFATRERGLVLDALLDGVRMGGHLAGRPTAGQLLVDLEGRAELYGVDLEAQLIGSGEGELPRLLARAPVRAGAVSRLSVSEDPGRWIVLRIADQRRPGPAAAAMAASGWGFGIAYTSPWYLG